jgi:hypothetical protein
MDWVVASKCRDSLVYEPLLPIIGPTMYAAQNAIESKNGNKQTQGYNRKCASAVLCSGSYCMGTSFNVSDNVCSFYSPILIYVRKYSVYNFWQCDEIDKVTRSNSNWVPLTTERFYRGKVSGNENKCFTFWLFSCADNFPLDAEEEQISFHSSKKLTYLQLCY